MSDDDLKTELERLRWENAALKKGASAGLRLKVSEKGGRLANASPSIALRSRQ